MCFCEFLHISASLNEVNKGTVPVTVLWKHLESQPVRQLMNLRQEISQDLSCRANLANSNTVGCGYLFI